MQQEYLITKKVNLNYNCILIETIPVNGLIPEFRPSCFALIHKDSISKPYTPILITNTLTFVIKKYDFGCLSEFIFNKNINDKLIITFPLNKQEYVNVYKNVLFIAGGTGITPCLQIMNHFTNNFTVLFFNKKKEDIFYATELNKISKLYIYTDEVDKRKVIIDKVKSINPDIVFVCGPYGFLEFVAGCKNPDKSQGILKGVLKECGLTESNVYKF